MFSCAAVRSRLNRSKHDATANATDHVLQMLAETCGAGAQRLAEIEEAERILHRSLHARVNDAMDEERFRILLLPSIAGSRPSNGHRGERAKACLLHRARA